jgi:hypothetical protein
MLRVNLITIFYCPVAYKKININMPLKILNNYKPFLHVHTVRLDNYRLIFYQLMHNWIFLKSILNLHQIDIKNLLYVLV